MIRYARRRHGDDAQLGASVEDPTAAALVTDHLDSATSPALDRLHELVRERM